MNQIIFRANTTLFAMKVLLVFVNDIGKPVKIPLDVRHIFDREITNHHSLS